MNQKIRDLVLSAFFLVLGLLLPFISGQIPQIGNMLLPMHLPVLLCGYICGWKYGGIIGFILPYLRNVMFGMPPLYPTGCAMSVELAIYGIVSGLLYKKMKKNNFVSIYVSLLCAMILGRVAWAIMQVILLGFSGQTFTFEMFMIGAFINAIPGIILQFVFIPAIVKIYGKIQSEHGK